jgi:hypothetical protein
VNQRTIEKISQNARVLWKIHNGSITVEPSILGLLDEPYRLALEVLEFSFDVDPKEVGQALGINWQSVKQIRRALTL